MKFYHKRLEVHILDVVFRNIHESDIRNVYVIIAVLLPLERLSDCGCNIYRLLVVIRNDCDSDLDFIDHDALLRIVRVNRAMRICDKWLLCRRDDQGLYIASRNNIGYLRTAGQPAPYIFVDVYAVHPLT